MRTLLKEFTDWITNSYVDDPAVQLAIDEAVLLDADEFDSGESIRLWHFDAPVVVLGRSSQVAVEVDEAYCRQCGIPVLRRCSGGASIAAGPGCLMYSVVLSFERRPELQKIDVAHRWVMQALLTAVRSQIPDVSQQGICDLTWRNRKFSGNSVRIARRHLLYHGTILYDADLEEISRCLTTAPRQPDYRAQRGHADFLTNLPICVSGLISLIESVFRGSDSMPSVEPTIETDGAYKERLLAGVQQLMQNRYTQHNWHHRH